MSCSAEYWPRLSRHELARTPVLLFCFAHRSLLYSGHSPPANPLRTPTRWILGRRCQSKSTHTTQLCTYRVGRRSRALGSWSCLLFFFLLVVFSPLCQAGWQQSSGPLLLSHFCRPLLSSSSASASPSASTFLRLPTIFLLLFFFLHRSSLNTHGHVVFGSLNRPANSEPAPDNIPEEKVSKRRKKLIPQPVTFLTPRLPIPARPRRLTMHFIP